jgi:hypothetical protein
VTDRGRPVEALQLVLRQFDGVVVIYSITDADGYADFSNLKVGRFFLTSDHDGGVPDSVNVEVLRNGPGNVTVQLRWPDTTPLAVRSVGGMVRGPDYYPSEAQIPLSLSLLEGVTAHVVATTVTDSKGRFAFPDGTPAGIYFLRVNPTVRRGPSGEKMEGMIAIEVSREANDSALDLDLGWSSCGLAYAQREPYPKMNVSKVCGDITDTGNAAVSEAQVLLLVVGNEARILEQTTSRVNGQFSIQERHDGIYELLVEYPGFQPCLQTIEIEAAESAGDCRRPIHIRLKLLI